MLAREALGLLMTHFFTSGYKGQVVGKLCCQIGGKTVCPMLTIQSHTVREAEVFWLRF